MYSPLALCRKVRSKRAKKSCHKETALVWRARAFMLKPVKEKERVRFIFSSLYPIHHHHHHYHQSFIMIKSKYTMPLATHGAFQTGGCGTQESADHFWRSEKRFYLNCFTDLSDVMMMTTTGNDDDGSCSFILGSVPVSLPTHLTLFSKDLFLHIFILFRSLSSCSLFSTPSYILCTKLSFFVLSSCIPASFQSDKETTSFKLCM